MKQVSNLIDRRKRVILIFFPEEEDEIVENIPQPLFPTLA